ncbi:nuclear transport factor 2 family protein [Laedolimicola sp.]|uniref:nuclear transport factor 2 family protein n=1 Tax=Laedolimicola sp. TaxID=2981663 RepID=UPI003F8199A7
MPRNDYNEIKTKFRNFLTLWKKGETEGMEHLVLADAKCNLSTAKDYADGSQHSLYGVKNFILDTPKTDVFHIEVCNYVCRLAGEKAQQSAVAVCRASRQEGDAVKTFEFSSFFVNSWVKTEEEWKISHLRMDIVDSHGDFPEFQNAWYFEEPKAKWFVGVHLPVIQGEMDSPWRCIPEAEDVLTEEEKVMECFSRYAYGIDTLAFSHVDEAISENAVVNMAPWGTMDKRGFLTTLKYHRQPSRYWTHSAKLESMEIDGDKCKARLYRMAGHRQRSHEVEIGLSNINTEYACARYEVEFAKEDGSWRITKLYYYLGILDLGEYED